MPLCPIFAFQDSCQQVRISDVPKKIGDWSIKRVEVECQFPDNQTTSYECVLVGGVWTTTIESCSTAGTTKNGFAVNGYDESGNKYILGKSDLYILTNDSRVIPQKELDVVNILPSKPETPHVGDAVFVDGKLEVYDGENWISIGSGVIESSDVPGWAENAMYAGSAGYADLASEADRATYATEAGFVYWNNVDGKPNIPARTSDLENDSGFVPYYDIPNRTSQLENDSGYTKVVESTIEAFRGYARDAEHAIVADMTNEADWANGVEWDNVQNKPSIPTVNDTTITIKQGGATKGTFTLNQATPKTIELDAGGGSNDGWSSVGLRLKSSGSDYGDDRVYGNYRYWSNSESHIEISTPGLYDRVGVIVTEDDGLSFKENEVVFVPCKADDPDAGKIMTFWVGGCLAGDTLISMADGTTKRIDELAFGDKVLSLNPYTMRLEEDEVIYTDSDLVKRHDTMDVWTFDDGTILNTIKPHQFYNVRLGRMEYIANFNIGDEVRKQDGTTMKLVEHQIETGDFRHFTLFTMKFNNYFANGILTGNRNSVKLGWYWIEQHKDNSNEE